MLTLLKRLPSLNCDIAARDNKNAQAFPSPRYWRHSQAAVVLRATGAFVQLNFSWNLYLRPFTTASLDFKLLS